LHPFPPQACGFALVPHAVRPATALQPPDRYGTKELLRGRSATQAPNSHLEGPAHWFQLHAMVPAPPEELGTGSKAALADHFDHHH